MSSYYTHSPVLWTFLFPFFTDSFIFTHGSQLNKPAPFQPHGLYLLLFLSPRFD